MAPARSDGSTIALGEFVLDLDAGTLLRDGRIVEMRAKAFLLLSHLARNRGKVLSKSELLDAVWPDVAVTEDSLTQAVRDIRICLGDETARHLRTIARRGYMLDATLNAAHSPSRTTFPRIAVLPFDDRATQPTLAPIIAILCDEIISGLSKFKMFTVIGRHSVEAATHMHSGDLERIARVLSADYIVTGTVWPSPEGFLLSVALTEAAMGAIMWTDSFNCAGDRVLRLRDAVPQQIVGHLFSSLETDSSAQARRLPTDSLTAFAHFARGIAALKAFRNETDRLASDHFQAAIEADPEFGLAYAYAALADVAANGYSFAPRTVKTRALMMARRGVHLAPDDARCQSTLGWLLGMAEEYDAAEQAVRLALRLNPTDSESISDAAFVLRMRGKLDDALKLMDLAFEINPLPPTLFLTVRYDILHLLGRYREAAEDLARVPELNGMRSLRMAAIQLKAGNETEARRHLSRANSLLPAGDWFPLAEQAWATERPEDFARIAQDIRDVLELSQ